MGAKNYLNFDLRIEKQGEKHIARVSSSPAGEAVGVFVHPFQGLQRQEWLKKTAKELGSDLYGALFHSQVGVCLRRSLDRARAQDRGLRLRFRLEDVPQLAELPWEYLYDPEGDKFLSLSIETPIVRYLALPEPTEPLAVQPPLRILVMISSPIDQIELDVDSEWTKLEKALGELETKGLVVLERLEEATLGALQKRLRQGEHHVFHYVGHGEFDERVQDGVLVLEDEERRSRYVGGQLLGTLLQDERNLRLIILNACEGARASDADPFSGTAQSLVRKQIPAVIAMQSEISDEAAMAFTNEFYAALADGYPVDAALAEARKAILVQGQEREWGTPVLYMRSPEGRIFDLSMDEEAGIPAPEAPTPPVVEVREKPEPRSTAEGVYTQRARPAKGGDSIGHYQTKGAATLGCLVVDRDELGRVYILCDTSGICPPWAREGDLILQPGPWDAGSAPDDVIATVARWAQVRATREAAAKNVSAAIALVRRLEDVSPQIHKRGFLRGVRTVSPGLPVYGAGRTSGMRDGTVLRVDAESELSWPLRQVLDGAASSSGDGSGHIPVPFAGLIETTPMMEAGDSGMILLDAENYALGLGFAGGSYGSLFVPMQRVLDALNVDLVTDSVWKSIT